VDKVREIINKIDFEGLVNKKTTLKRKGDKLVGLSPLTNEKTPSFFVNPVTKTWWCFSSGEGGGVLDYIMKVESLSKDEAIRLLAEYAGVDLESEDDPQAPAKRALRLAHEFYRRHVDPAIEYLQGRMISLDMVDLYEVGYADNTDSLLNYLRASGVTEEVFISSGLGMKLEDGKVISRFRNRAMLPIHDEYGTLVSFTGRDLSGHAKAKYLHGPSTTLFNKKKIVWGLKYARKLIIDHGYVTVCEGQIDAMALVDAGIPAVAILGSSLSEEQLLLLSKLSQNIYLTFDSDDAGNRGLVKTLPMAKNLGIDSILYAIVLPKGQDPDVFINTYGAAEFHKLRQEAASDTSVFVKSVIKSHYKEGATKTAIAKKVLGELKGFFHQTFTYRSLDLLERLAQEFSLNPKELREWVSREPNFRGGGILDKKINSMSFPAPIYERRILYSILSNPSLIAKISNSTISFGDFSSHLVSKTLELIEPHFSPEEVFDRIKEALSKEESDMVLKFYSTGLPGSDFDTSFDILKFNVSQRQKSAKTSFLGRPSTYTEKELKGVVKEILDYKEKS
jgi:DNA primase catalytic core